MRTSWLVLLVTVYVSLDLANPLMPGALTFGFEDSVKVRQPERFRGHNDAVLTPATPPSELPDQTEDRAAASLVAAADVDRIRPREVQRARSSLSTPAPPSEDHH